MAMIQHGKASAFLMAVAMAVVLAGSLGLGSGSRATAEDLPREAVLPLALANKAASAALEKCRQDGYRVSVTVVDRAGLIRTLMRGDGAGPHTTDSSSKKAYTAASLRRPTSELAEMISKMPALQSLRDMNEKMLMLGGGLPIEIGGEVIGGIGVGGAPGANFDDACAQAGLDALKNR
jgi:uncharacterized protein GlcG (DUF336 family)